MWIGILSVLVLLPLVFWTIERVIQLLYHEVRITELTGFCFYVYAHLLSQGTYIFVEIVFVNQNRILAYDTECGTFIAFTK